MLLLIVNPVAGTGFSLKSSEMLQAKLKEKNIPFEVALTSHPGHATEIAKAAGESGKYEAVLSVGGDGTAFEVASGLLGTSTPLGIIPSGTGNDFIKSIGTPSTPEAALDFILSAKPRPVDVGRWDDKMFLNVCGTGFDVQVLENTLRFKAHFRGIIPYLFGLVCAIFQYKPVHVKYSIDNGEKQERDALIFSVDNGKYIGGGIPICPAATVGDGKLDITIVDHVPRWKIPFYLPALLSGKLLQKKITHHVLCSSVEIYSDKMRLNVDGEIFSVDSASFSIISGKLLLFW